MPEILAILCAWGVLFLGAALVAYASVKWRRAARACYPMPFHRRTGYLTGVLFGAVIMVVPMVVFQSGAALV